MPDSRVSNEQHARATYGDALVNRLIALGDQGDPVGDAVVAAFSKLPGGSGWTLLDAGLHNGGRVPRTAPSALKELLQDVRRPPAWLDDDMVNAGAVAMWRAGSPLLLLAYAAGALAYGYRSANLVRPLAATGRIEKLAPRRLGETTRWVLEVTQPGALAQGGSGVAATVRLRLVHALVRRRLLAQPDWDRARWGVPISAEDVLATGVAGFLVQPVRALGDLGVRYSPAELEAMTHQWRWITALMGGPADLIPTSWHQATQLSDAMIALDPGPNADGTRLMDALLFHSMAPRFGPLTPVARVLRGHMLGGLARRWLGDPLADRLEVPDTVLQHLPLAIRPAIVARDLVRATGLLGGDERLARFESMLAARVVDVVKAPPTLTPSQLAA